MATIPIEMVWLIALLDTFGVQHKQLVALYYDSKADLFISVNLVYHERTKHIEVDCHLTREKIQDFDQDFPCSYTATVDRLIHKTSSSKTILVSLIQDELN